MHYKNGRPAQVGDLAIGRDTGGTICAGTVQEIIPGSDTCNAYIVDTTGSVRSLVSLKDLVHVEDAVIACDNWFKEQAEPPQTPPPDPNPESEPESPDPGNGTPEPAGA